MIRKIAIIFFLINVFLFPKTYATDEIILSQMDALNLDSFAQDGQRYTEESFPDMDIKELLNSAISGNIDNKKISKDIFLILGNEVISCISILGSILIIIVTHSLLKSFTENLNSSEGIGQIAYYVQYILIVSLIMANFTNILNMIKETIENLVGFVNSLVPILLALMSATRKYCISNTYTTINNIFSCIYCKYNNIFNTPYNIDCNSNWNSVKYF